MTLDGEMGAEHIQIQVNSQLIASQIRWEGPTKGPLLQQYLKLATKRLERFKAFEIVHVPREENTCVDVLKLATERSLDIYHYFIQETKKTKH